MQKHSIQEPNPYPAGSRLSLAVDFLRRPDLRELPIGRYELGQGVFAMVQTPVLKSWGEGLPEIHRKYIDVQSPISRRETIGIGAAPAEPPEDFDAERDIAFIDVPVEPLTLEPGEYAVLYPADAHAPCRTLEEPGEIRKVVIKVPVD